MVLRHNHYEVAFEEYVRSACIPYVAVDEKRRALLADSSLKSMDFIVYGASGQNLLIDVKGRQFPSGMGPEANGSGHKWVNWATNDDVTSLLKWEQVFGENFTAHLVFAYEVLSPCWYGELEQLYFYKDRAYSFYAVAVKDYYIEMKRGSISWDTYFMPAEAYRRLVVPLGDLFQFPESATPATQSESPKMEKLSH